MRLNNLVPMLNVKNITASLEFYEKALGFSVVSDHKAVEEWKWATIRSGSTELMLSESNCKIKLEKNIDPQLNTNWPVIFYFYPQSVAEIYEHVKSSGFSPTNLMNTIYGMKEFSIQDPDGHVLSFGEDASE